MLDSLLRILGQILTLLAQILLIIGFLAFFSLLAPFATFRTCYRPCPYKVLEDHGDYVTVYVKKWKCSGTYKLKVERSFNYGEFGTNTGYVVFDPYEQNRRKRTYYIFWREAGQQGYNYEFDGNQRKAFFKAYRDAINNDYYSSLR